MEKFNNQECIALIDSLPSLIKVYDEATDKVQKKQNMTIIKNTLKVVKSFIALNEKHYDVLAAQIKEKEIEVQ